MATNSPPSISLCFQHFRRAMSGAKKGMARKPRARRHKRPGFGDGTSPTKPTTLASGTMQISRSVGKPFQMVRSTTFGDMAKAAVDQGYVFNFQVGLLGSTSDFTGMFDQYRIVWMELTFQWTNVGTVAQPPTLFVAQDWDSVATAPASADVMAQRANMKVVMFDATHRTFTLKIARPGVLVSVPTGASLFKRAPYLDLADLTVPHFGPLVWANQYNTALASGTLQTMWRVGVEFRGIR